MVPTVGSILQFSGTETSAALGNKAALNTDSRQWLSALPSPAVWCTGILLSA